MIHALWSALSVMAGFMYVSEIDIGTLLRQPLPRTVHFPVLLEHWMPLSHQKFDQPSIVVPSFFTDPTWSILPCFTDHHTIGPEITYLITLLISLHEWQLAKYIFLTKPIIFQSPRQMDWFEPLLQLLKVENQTIAIRLSPSLISNPFNPQPIAQWK